MSLMDHLSPIAHSVPESGIVEVVNHGRSREGLIALWVGEGDQPTPAFISDAASASLTRGETFYTWQRGIPNLRQELASYHSRHFGASFDANEFYVTVSGMQAIRIGLEAIVPAGSEVLYLSPAWPNFPAAVTISGSQPVPVLLEFTERGWSLDLGRLEASITPRTKAIFVNSPSNPTGWTASADDLRQILDLARRHGLWIMADEIYSRFYYAGGRAPSFFDIREEGDRILFVNSFSKNWAMTGWRMGWITAPPEMGQVLENLIQYATSGVPHFLQQGAAAALEHGDGFVDEQVERARQARDLFCDALLATNRVRLVKPDGAFYAFFAIDGIADPRRAALDIVDSTAVGLAPGTAFGAGGSPFFRACFLRRLDHVTQAADRLQAFIADR
ncbi:aminotransferase [Rhizobium albus]|nr:aminotransferase [Rhizobium albus]